MTTLQAIVYALVQAVTEILPLGSSAHLDLLNLLFEWPRPDAIFHGSILLAITLGLFLFFRHDWASIFSSFLKCILLRRPLQAFDERVFFYFLLTTLPSLGLWFYILQTQGHPPEYRGWQHAPWISVFGLLGGSLTLWVADRFGKKLKSLVNWNWLDALFLGFFQLGAFFPGFDRNAGSFSYAMVRNFDIEATLKFTLLSSTPVLGFFAYQNLQGLNFKLPEPSPGLSWLSLGVSFVVAFFTTLLTLGNLLRQRPPGTPSGFNTYALYRMLVAGALTFTALSRF